MRWSYGKSLSTLRQRRRQNIWDYISAMHINRIWKESKCSCDARGVHASSCGTWCGSLITNYTYVSFELNFAFSSPFTHPLHPSKQDQSFPFQLSTRGLSYAKSLIRNVAASIVSWLAWSQNQWIRPSKGFAGILIKYAKIGPRKSSFAPSVLTGESRRFVSSFSTWAVSTIDVMNDYQAKSQLTVIDSAGTEVGKRREPVIPSDM